MAVKDEFRLHLYYLSNLIVKYPRIVVYGPYGEGKDTLFRTLKKKFSDVNFYAGENGLESPFVYAIMDTDDIIPEFDIIYCMQYSTEYKEGRTGYVFPDGEWHPMIDYVEKAENIKKSKRNLSGKTFKTIEQLKKAI